MGFINFDYKEKSKLGIFQLSLIFIPSQRNQSYFIIYVTLEMIKSYPHFSLFKLIDFVNLVDNCLFELRMTSCKIDVIIN